MAWVTVATVGGSLVSNYIGGQSAQDAAKAQTASGQQAMAVTQAQFNALQKNLSPYMQAGQSALSAYQDLLGIGGQPAMIEQQMPSQAAGQVPTQGRGIFGTAGAGFGSAGAGLGGAQMPGQTQYISQPFSAQSAQNAQQQAIARLSQSPQMQAMLQQGENAMLQNASATGGLRGGNIQAALGQFRPQLLNQMIQQQLGQLSGLAGLGQSSAAGVGAQGMNMAGNMSNLLGQQGSFQAGGIMAGSQANQNMLGNIVGGFQGYMNNPSNAPAPAGVTGYPGSIGSTSSVPGFYTPQTF